MTDKATALVVRDYALARRVVIGLTPPSGSEELARAVAASPTLNDPALERVALCSNRAADELFAEIVEVLTIPEMLTSPLAHRRLLFEALRAYGELARKAGVQP